MVSDTLLTDAVFYGYNLNLKMLWISFLTTFILFFVILFTTETSREYSCA